MPWATEPSTAPATAVTASWDGSVGTTVSVAASDPEERSRRRPVGLVTALVDGVDHVAQADGDGVELRRHRGQVAAQHREVPRGGTESTGTAVVPHMIFGGLAAAPPTVPAPAIVNVCGFVPVTRATPLTETEAWPSDPTVLTPPTSVASLRVSRSR